MTMNGRTRLNRMPQWALPAEPLAAHHRRILLLMALASMSSAFVNTLFTQTVAYAADEFDVGRTGQGIGAAIVRWGIIISLPLVALADRHGRRPLIITVAWCAPLVSALGAVAPSFEFLVATQTIGRPLGLTLDILIAVVAIEEMPRNARAYATGLLAVLSGLGAGIAVASLPLADLGPSAWRFVYVVTLIWTITAFIITKHLPESKRFIPRIDITADMHAAAKKALRRNIGRICSVVFLTNLYIATASIFQNRYLKEQRDYSATLIAIFTIATSSPASLGLLVGGRLADEKGRRLLGATMVPLGALLLALSFTTSGIVMWCTAIAGGIAFGMSFPAMAVYRGELFPTSVRSLAGGIIMTSALVGGSFGLIGGGLFLDNDISYGSVMMWLVLGPVVASLIVWFRYPETAHLSLEEITSSPASQ
ncbi:MAG: MFS transporter [Actinobacteria bacterium]|nr:MFS transporter [Actinomycetota bacterium]